MLIAACPDPECDAPAEIIPWAIADSTHGPVPHIRTLCANKHRYLLPDTSITSYDTRRVHDPNRVEPTRPAGDRNPS